MNNKGLTLIELLAVIVVIALVSLIVYPQISKTITDTKTTAFNTQKESIKEAAIEYLADKVGTSNFFELETDTEEIITFKTLYDEGYLTGDTNNAKTGKPLNQEKTIVTIGRTGSKGSYNYTYTVDIIDES